ncbi:MAG: 50S ribosomal protein L9 [Gemmatimonadetes bacterium]|uniref:Large ribosomal subunit protein bL9 n=1 Tax=Candidatus Kutchimonas denitrificans TaxID=3056748 RepID=A0AAE4ZB97_9BACT|nr:50S ribosomal protein L9 [Gemmatimonadota bacterium]NIR74996.1 50S ribosomal protein L9 [Candidatus Kutchimonas denitrificans]NIS01579.1 50S ribosomal protein L9 [Gemmatimonadota bacterium]NIT67317.1 50S ribosomal protein L9 [Gemmatimonadota bacterium]NIU52680.1 50S ribosomal protein L9 [Gemmatimonadota bacterium]
MDVILRRKVANLGDVGDIVSVKAGYARNFLLPQGLAYRSTEANRQRLERERTAALAAEERDRAAARTLADRLEGASITFSMLAGDEGKLYGSVGPRDIAGKLTEDGYEVEPRQVLLQETIKMLGVYSVPIRLYPEVEASVKVWVIKEEEE